MTLSIMAVLLCSVSLMLNVTYKPFMRSVTCKPFMLSAIILNVVMECRSAGYSCEKSKERIFKKILKLKILLEGALTLID
jgi:hypothetical protein